jgi:hypothetical protein
MMSYYFVPFEQFDYESNFLVQGGCQCDLPELIHAINGERIDTLSICEMHNHAGEYLNVGECIFLAIVNNSVIKITAIIHNKNTILKIQEGVFPGFSIEFDPDQQRLLEIALIDTPTFQDNELKGFNEAITRRRLVYFWALRAKGFQVDEAEIRKLEVEIYPDVQEFKHGIVHSLCQRDVDELQLLLALVEPQQETSDSLLKALLLRLQHTTVRMWKEDNHQRPHFHIEYKNHYNGSYAIDTLECLAGNVPSRYEKPILKWAFENQKSLKLTWDQLQVGKDIRELVSPAERT